MATVRLLYVAAAVFSVCLGLEGFDGVLSDPKQCEESCIKSYSPHTNPKVSVCGEKGAR